MTVIIVSVYDIAKIPFFLQLQMYFHKKIAETWLFFAMIEYFGANFHKKKQRELDFDVQFPAQMTPVYSNLSGFQTILI